MPISSSRSDRIRRLVERLPALTDAQLNWVSTVVAQFEKPHTFRVNPDSNLMTQQIMQDFGDALRIHHCFSMEPFTKDKFEYVLEQTLILNGINAQLAPRGNPGHDITIQGTKFSLKTQADRNIRPDKIHISKVMELGKGNWSDNDKDLVGLREQFLRQMKAYGRILTLRTISRPPSQWHYELVEIPKKLLLEVMHGKFEMMHESKQMPKPGYCRVFDSSGSEKFALYFDGGGERKLQLKGLLKRYCIVHAEWSFPASVM